MGFANAIQVSIYQALVNNAALDALLARAIGMSSPAIYDKVTQPADTGNNSAFPYVTIGDDLIRQWDTDDSQGAEGEITIHAWSRKDGRREAKEVLAAVYDALARAELTVSGHEFVGIEFEQEGPVVLDPDGETYHGTAQYRIYIDRL